MTPKFLVVDDDADTRALVEAILLSIGCEVTLADSGSRALELVQTEDQAKEFDAIFLDVMMPGLSGYAVLETLKKNPHTESIPVVMLTAKGNAHEIIEGYQTGADYYIPKPFTREQLIYGLNLLLGEIEEEQPEEEPKKKQVTYITKFEA